MNEERRQKEKDMEVLLGEGEEITRVVRNIGKREDKTKPERVNQPESENVYHTCCSG